MIWRSAKKCRSAGPRYWRYGSAHL